MRSFDDICKDVMSRVMSREEEIPGDYNLIESNCYICMKQLMNMFNNGYINKELAGKNKMKIKKSYEESVKDFEFKIDMFNEHIKCINKTEENRIKLRKLLNESSGDTGLAEITRVCFDIIDSVFPRRI